MSRRERDFSTRPKRQPSRERMPAREIEFEGPIGTIHLLEGGAARYELRIDAEGRWFHEGVEIVRDDIRVLFSRSLVRRKNGEYYVEIANDEFPVIVEDVPLIVARVTRNPKGDLMLLLNDGAAERLEARTIIFRDNVPYCDVRSNIEARFSRPAYYQLAQFIEYDEKEKKYYLMADGKTVYLDA
ncbi:DUF1285 domain-containing protein [Candidatus Poribacteria bacterium]|nr:DUF1285 domain-containing protein [Candidatus Poribacteria bacterium]